MMRKATLFLLASLVVAPLSASANFGYTCENSEFRIKADSKGVTYGINLDNKPQEVLKKLFDNESTVSVTDLKTNKTYTYNLVAVIEDGAGQTSFQAFKIDKKSSLTPLKMKTDFYYEHEGGCLEGQIYSERKEEWVGWDRCWGDGDERMMCTYVEHGE